MSKVVEFSIDGNDTFSHYFSQCLTNHPYVHFASYKRSHFLEKKDSSFFKVVYAENKDIQKILQEIQQTMRSHINEIEDTFEWSLHNFQLESTSA